MTLRYWSRADYLGAIAALDPFQAKLPWGCVRLGPAISSLFDPLDRRIGR